MSLFFKEGGKVGRGVSVMDYVSGDNPAFFSPIPIWGQEQGPIPTNEKPLMLFLPGIDSTGMTAIQQFPALLKNFDLRSFSVPTEDRTSFSGLVDIVEKFLRQELESSPPSRPVYLMGESFGGVMCLAVAHRCPTLVHRLVIVNPATSFSRSIWPRLGPLLNDLPDNVYNDILPVVLSPLMTDVVSIGQGIADRIAEERAQQPEADALTQLGQLVGSLSVVGEKLGNVSTLSDILPKPTLSWKFKLIEQGSQYVESKLGSILQRVLVVCGENDRLIPSAEEAARLARFLPRCTTKILPGKGHAMLMDDDVDIMKIIEEKGFYTTERRMSASPKTKKGNKESLGYAGPMELPTAKEVEDNSEGFVNTLTRLTSPVFFSTGEDGRVLRGLGALPDARPLLVVGNHQTFAPDLGILVPQLLKEKNIMIRGLAHPFIFGKRESSDGGATPPTPTGLGLLTSYGAVPVSPKNMYQLLENGETVLLYPGGIREAYKYRGEDYQLVWPNRPEVIRMAARFNATIVPLSAIGVDDGLDIALDGRELINLPFVGQRLQQQMGNGIPGARKGVALSEEIKENWVMPLPSFPPKLPGRFYFLFGKPIKTSRDDMKNVEVVQAQYDELKSGVEGGIQYLLKKRKSDPYNNFVQRTLYESSFDWKKQAPTFDP
eukprot:CAMPEP_0196575412 /NCGR_PEP_ID=MMETSP1081-20130531/4895_1 /TAXON_ID=36882 /ORGANISM="Pyramimonas amylifera, Strain CCMP720" /LENGTH=659 /DNA_ID=CAMNT_0041893709 /DNA_START=209 /DNA_END=2188 /DNA_ORIENTATION=-